MVHEESISLFVHGSSGKWGRAGCEIRTAGRALAPELGNRAAPVEAEATQSGQAAAANTPQAQEEAAVLDLHAPHEGIPPVLSMLQVCVPGLSVHWQIARKCIPSNLVAIIRPELLRSGR
jgi:hypothetical protein